jgi:hypothetical protein
MAVIRLSDPELFSVLSPSPPLVLVAAAAFVLGIAHGAGVAISLPLALALGLVAASGLAVAVRAGSLGRPHRPAWSPGRGGLYAILGVAPEAESVEIERAFRARVSGYLARQPDAVTLSEMIGLSLAYETLSDSVRRASYDRRRTAGRHPSLSVEFSAG